MEQQDPPQRYLWPRFVLAGVVLGIVLAIFWMTALVRRVREQREDIAWPTNAAKSTQSVSVPSAPTNPAPAQPVPPTNVAPPKGER